MPEQTLLDAVSAGIESAGPTPLPVEDNDEATNLDGDATADAEIGSETEGDESSDGGDQDAADGTEGESEADADAAGEEGDADASADAKAAAGDKAGAKAAEPVLKAKDPVNDPIPNALKKETKERVESLIGIVREKDAAVKAAIADRDEILGMITETKSTPEQYGQALNYLSLVNSGDPVKLEQALGLMQQEVAVIARMLGKPVAGVDMLSEHPDLKQQVADNLLLQEHAEEIAAGRSRQKFQTAQSQQTQQTQQQTAAQQAAVQQGREALNTLGAQLQKSDPDFARKKEVLVPALQEVFSKIPPALWANAFKKAYDGLKLPKTAVAAKVPGQQPLRGKSPSGGAAKAPGSMAEAISAGIDMASGR